MNSAHKETHAAKRGDKNRRFFRAALRSVGAERLRHDTRSLFRWQGAHRLLQALCFLIQADPVQFADQPDPFLGTMMTRQRRVLLAKLYHGLLSIADLMVDRPPSRCEKR